MKLHAPALMLALLLAAACVPVEPYTTGLGQEPLLPRKDRPGAVVPWAIRFGMRQQPSLSVDLPPAAIEDH